MKTVRLTADIVPYLDSAFVNVSFNASVNLTVFIDLGYKNCSVKSVNGPLATNDLYREMWIAPDGTMYGCITWGSHEMTAQDILRVLFNEDVRYFDSGDILIARGWIKVTSSYVMHQCYEEAGYYDNMTDEQWKVYMSWKEKYL